MTTIEDIAVRNTTHTARVINLLERMGRSRQEFSDILRRMVPVTPPDLMVDVIDNTRAFNTMTEELVESLQDIGRDIMEMIEVVSSEKT